VADPISTKSSSTLKSLTTPRAAAAAGVAFALLFGANLILIRSSLPEGAQPGSQWLDAAGGKMKIAAILMPFAGISFLWFIGVVRDGLGRLEDRFFATVFLGSGLLFLAMMFITSAIGAGLAASDSAVGQELLGHTEVALFGQMVVLALAKTYALRMAAVFMISLATIWLRTGLMPRWLVYVSYLLAVVLLIAGDVSMWLTLSFPIWVLVVSLLLLARAGVFEDHQATARDRNP
jgi:preprotein translocase subunit Sec61beta